MLGKIEGRRRRSRQRTRWLDGTNVSMDMSLSKFREMVKDKEAWHATVHGAAKGQTWLSDWTTITCLCPSSFHKVQTSHSDFLTQLGGHMAKLSHKELKRCQPFSLQGNQQQNEKDNLQNGRKYSQMMSDKELISKIHIARITQYKKKPY